MVKSFRVAHSFWLTEFVLGGGVIQVGGVV